MTDENKINLLQKNGIFLHKLPLEYIKEALDHYPRECIYKNIHDDKGLQIYFHEKDQALEYAHKPEIKIKGQLFKVSFTATCLTVHGISKGLPDQAIQAAIESNGYKNIVSLYERETMNANDSSVIDYCIILKIPEILYHYPLKSVSWPEQERCFKVSFFCRFCRRNGHKSCDCPMLEPPVIKCDERIEQKSKKNSKQESLGQFHIQTGSGTTNITDFRVSIVNNYQSVSPDEGYTSSTSCSPLKRKPQPKKMDKTLKHTEKQPKPGTSGLQRTKSKRKKRRTISLSPRIKRAICKTAEVANSESLINYLNSVRRRKDKKLRELTNNHTGDIPKLIKELEAVSNTFNTVIAKKGKRKNEDNDLKFLENLGERLRKLISSDSE